MEPLFICKIFLTIRQFLFFSALKKKEGRNMNKSIKKFMNLVWGL